MAGVLTAVAAAGLVASVYGTGASVALARPATAKPLAGKIVGIDAGHNGRNWTDPAFLNRQVWNGREWEDCDTTGTQTASGYTEARYNFNVARYLRADLRRDGARVVLTRTSNNGIGPCHPHRVPQAHDDAGEHL
jgi:N-acetylmuramoyl-L-alanine amidase